MGLRDALREAATAAASAALSQLQKADDEDESPGDGKNDLPKDGDGRPAPVTIEQLEEALTDPKSLFWDPFAVIDALGYKDKPSSVSYGTLQQMVWQMPIIQSIVLQRQNQVANFCRPQSHRLLPGFRVCLEDDEAEETDEIRTLTKSLEQWLLSTGTTKNPEGRDNFVRAETGPRAQGHGVLR